VGVIVTLCLFNIRQKRTNGVGYRAHLYAYFISHILKLKQNALNRHFCNPIRKLTRRLPRIYRL